MVIYINVLCFFLIGNDSVSGVPKAAILDFLYHLTNVFTNCSMNIDQLVFKLLEVTLVLVRKSLKFLLLRNQVPIVGQSMNNRNFFPDENFLSDETSLMLFHIEKSLH